MKKLVEKIIISSAAKDKLIVDASTYLTDDKTTLTQLMPWHQTSPMASAVPMLSKAKVLGLI